MSHSNVLTEPRVKAEWPPLPGHWESILAAETGKRLLCSTQEGYHYTVYRKNFINTGSYHGRPIDDFPASEFVRLCRTWGVGYVAVWTQRGRRYFSRASDDFRQVWSGMPYTVFQVLNGDLRSVAVARGLGVLEDRDCFAKTVTLQDVVKGDTAVIRQNYFPAWTARCNGVRIPVFDRDGQLAVVVPESGSMAVEFSFPKYHRFTIIAALSLLAAFLYFLGWPWLAARKSKRVGPTL